MSTEGRTHLAAPSNVLGRLVRRPLPLPFATALMLVAVLAVAQAPSSGDLLSLYAPAILADGRHITTTGVPAAHVLNPALTAAEPRVNIGLGYIALFDDDQDDDKLGHVINAGATIPTPIGVWGVSGHFFSSPLEDVPIGPLGALHASFAKELYPGLFLGAGLGVQAGTSDASDPDAFAWGAGLDLGLLHLAGDLGPLKELSWGVAFRGIGKGFAAPTEKKEYSVYAPAFTPAAGVSFYPVRGRELSVAAKLDLWAPTMQALRLEIGTALLIRDFLELKAHYPLHLIGSGERIENPGFGLTLSFGFGLPENLELVGFGQQDWSRGEVNVHAAAAPLREGAWGLGLGTNIALGIVDEDPPDIALDSADVEYRSPNLDGIQDDLILPVSITDSGLVVGYLLVIEDGAGNVVRTIRNKDWLPEPQGVQGALDRLLAVKSGVNVPDALRWDGRSTGGNVVPDGSYQYYLEAWDDRGNRASSQRRTVVIDNFPPQVTARAVDLVFSPNDDGNKDALTIQQHVSAEDRWQAEMLDARGASVATFAWDVDAPATVVWDGRRSDGTLATDGVYSYHLAGTDRAGNRTELRLPNIIINTQATPISVRLTDADISPNDDGADDTTDYRLGVPVLSGVQRWELAIRNAAGDVVRRFNGTSRVPDRVSFDGRDDSGRRLPEGTYRARLDVTYENGNRPHAEPPDLVVDLTAPAATIKAALVVFSPDGDGNKDTVTVFQESFDEALWTGTLRGADGSVVRTQIWHGTPDDSYTWDGRRADGLPAADGTYRYTLEAHDSAGNSGSSNAIDVRLDTADTPVFLSTNASHFSPNSDGVADQVVILPRLEDRTGIERYTLTIHAGRGSADTAEVLRVLAGRDGVPEQIIWDGLDDAGDRVTDGAYFAAIKVFYTKGNNPTARSPAFIVDTEYPQAELTADSLMLSPDGDGRRDVIHVGQSSSSEDSWEGEITDLSGTVVRSLFWRGELTSFSWDALDENGNLVTNGSYTYRVTGRDHAGNTATAVLEGIEVDNRATPLFVTLAADGFSPNGDGVRDTQAIGNVVGLDEGIRTWQVQFIHAEGGPQRSMGGTGRVPERIVWDGLTDRGTAAPEGSYVAEVALDYLKGNQPRERTATFHLDSTAPVISLDLAPQPFSPDNDGIDDELTLAVSIDDLSPISGWSMTITDPQGSLFSTFSGRGTPSDRIIWDGVSDTGELVQSALDYPVALAASDALGNTSIIHTVIPVDVLVIRDGDKLKIRIASITFPPSSADLARVSGDAAVRNERTIRRLGQIFTKNRAYTIRIEGHANSVLFENVEAAAREQRDVLLPLSGARAEAVKRELVALGVDAGRITTDGLGGASPVVPFSDQQNRWKNRRVEFILTGRGS